MSYFYAALPSPRQRPQNHTMLSHKSLTTFTTPPQRSLRKIRNRIWVLGVGESFSPIVDHLICRSHRQLNGHRRAHCHLLGNKNIPSRITDAACSKEKGGSHSRAKTLLFSVRVNLALCLFVRWPLTLSFHGVHDLYSFKTSLLSLFTPPPAQTLDHSAQTQEVTLNLWKKQEPKYCAEGFI